MVGALRNGAATALVTALVYGLVALWDMSLRDPRYLDGWLLATFMLVQLTYHLRRGAIARTVATAAKWMKAHIYTGYLVVALFLLHTEFRLPQGGIEWVLWLSFAATAVSGIVGTYFSATIPASLDLDARGLKFDDLAPARRRLAQEAAELATRAAADPRTHAIAELYATTLHGYFARAQNILQHMRKSPWPLRRLTLQLDAIEKHLEADGREIVHQTRRLTAAKSYLDYQYAQHLLLQAWLFVHVPATYGLVVATILHIAHAYAFTAGVP